MIILGIDPGQKGGIAVLRDNLTLAQLQPFYKERLENVILLNKIIQKYNKQQVFAFVEEGQAYPGQGVVSTYNFGFFHGYIFGSLVLHCQLEYVRPQKWQKFHGILPPRKPTKGLTQKEKQKIQRERRKQIKLNSLQKAKEKFPEWAEEIGKKDGLSDAILIAWYGLAQVRGKNEKC